MTALIVSLLLSAEAPKPKHIDFTTEDVIEGTLKSPDLLDIQTYKPPKFGNLIKRRENFNDKIVRSVDQM